MERQMTEYKVRVANYFRDRFFDHKTRRTRQYYTSRKRQAVVSRLLMEELQARKPREVYEIVVTKRIVLQTSLEIRWRKNGRKFQYENGWLYWQKSKDGILTTRPKRKISSSIRQWINTSIEEAQRRLNKLKINMR